MAHANHVQFHRARARRPLGFTSVFLSVFLSGGAGGGAVDGVWTGPTCCADGATCTYQDVVSF